MRARCLALPCPAATQVRILQRSVGIDGCCSSPPRRTQPPPSPYTTLLKTVFRPQSVPTAEHSAEAEGAARPDTVSGFNAALGKTLAGKTHNWSTPFETARAHSGQ